MPHLIGLLRFQYPGVRNINVSRKSAINQAKRFTPGSEQSIDIARFRTIYCSFKNFRLAGVRGIPHFYQMAETLGEKLRAAREARGISVRDVAEQTRIAPMYIECIENDNYKPLPGGIFNKGFVKSYARFIGMDENEALQDYSRLLSQTESSTPPVEEFRSYRPEVLTDDRASQSSLATIVIAGVILAIMTFGIYMLVSWLRSEPSAPTAATNTNTSNQTAAQQPDAATPAPAGDVPTMQNLRVEFRTASEPISLSATSDGRNSVNTVTPSAPQIFEPRQSLRLSYAKALAPSAQLFINGKQIVLPTAPANPRRIPIEIDINAANLAQVWQSGQYTFQVQAPADTTTPVATPSTPRPAASTTPRTNANTAAADRPAPARTPVVVGNAPRPTPRPDQE
jgi:cytoskeleton protein RodZ